MGATPVDERVIGIVDDDGSVRMAIRSLLRSLGFKVEDSFEDIIRVHVDEELGGKIAA